MVMLGVIVNSNPNWKHIGNFFVTFIAQFIFKVVEHPQTMLPTGIEFFYMAATSAATAFIIYGINKKVD